MRSHKALVNKITQATCKHERQGFQICSYAPFIGRTKKTAPKVYRVYINTHDGLRCIAEETTASEAWMRAFYSLRRLHAFAGMGYTETDLIRMEANDHEEKGGTASTSAG